jgi:hypothetical protein
MSNLLLISIARKSDGIIVGDKTPSKTIRAIDMIRENVRKVTSSTKLRNGKSTRHSLDDEVGGVSVKYNILLHTTLVFVVVTAEDYERRIAFQLLEMLANAFDRSPSLMSAAASSKEYGMRRNGEYSKLASAALADYEDPTNVDTMARVQATIENTKNSLDSTITGLMKNVEIANDVEAKSAVLQDNTLGFKEGARKANCIQKKRGIMLTATIVGIIATVVIILVVLLIVVIVVNVCKGGGCEKEKDDDRRRLLRMLRLL